MNVLGNTWLLKIKLSFGSYIQLEIYKSVALKLDTPFNESGIISVFKMCVSAEELRGS